LEENCIQLGHLTFQERWARWSCLAFSSIDSTGNICLSVTLSYSIGSFIFFLPIIILQATEIPTII
jgi:hypothetical protein